MKVETIDKGEIQVTFWPVSREDGLHKVFPVGKWREAIGTYLDGVWSESDGLAAGTLTFPGGIYLRLSRGVAMYDISCSASTPVIERPLLNPDRIYSVTNDRNHVELGFAKFMRSSLKQMMVIEFSKVRFMLWKGRERSDLFLTVTDRTY